MTSRRVLVVSYLPPTRGGIATWAEILRIGTSRARRRFLFERVGGPGSVDRGGLVVKILHAIRLVVGVTRRLVLSRPELVHITCCIFPPGLWRALAVAILERMRRVPLVVH